MKILILNGPNLNLLGRREPSVYGDRSFDEYFQVLQKRYAKHELEYFQSNSEGEIISKIHQVGFDYDGIVLNAGAYTHTSIAIADAIRAVHTPVVELHISNVYAREEYRHRSMIAPACRGCICGFGLKGYDLAIESFLGDEAASKKPLGKKWQKAFEIAEELRANGDRLSVIAEKLNQMEVKTPRGKVWTVQTVGRMLQKKKN